MAWRPVVGLAAALGVLTGIALLGLVPRRPFVPPLDKHMDAGTGDGRGFNLLFVIGSLDTATRMAYLLFLPFLSQAKGGREATVGLGLALLFLRGALGKATCGWLGQRFGVVWSVIITEAATALLVLATLVLPLALLLASLPLLGIVLNGTSSILYGTVPELARKGELSRAFALFYTGVIGSGGLAPIVYGALADHSNRTIGVVAAAMTAAIIVPLVLALRPFLVKAGADGA
jgi:predicted MFS family arabinose efflux permease